MGPISIHIIRCHYLQLNNYNLQCYSITIQLIYNVIRMYAWQLRTKRATPSMTTISLKFQRKCSDEAKVPLKWQSKLTMKAVSSYYVTCILSPADRGCEVLALFSYYSLFHHIIIIVPSLSRVARHFLQTACSHKLVWTEVS